MCKKDSMKYFKTDIFSDTYQQEDKKAKIEKKYVNNYVNGTLNSNLNFMTPVLFIFEYKIIF